RIDPGDDETTVSACDVDRAPVEADEEQRTPATDREDLPQRAPGPEQPPAAARAASEGEGAQVEEVHPVARREAGDRTDAVDPQPRGHVVPVEQPFDGLPGVDRPVAVGSRSAAPPDR